MELKCRDCDWDGLVLLVAMKREEEEEEEKTEGKDSLLVLVQDSQCGKS